MDALKRYFRSPAAVAGLILLLIVIAMAVSAGWFYPRDPLALAGRPLVWPFANPRFLLGTDNSGRDIAAQIFYGARISLLIGGVATAIAIAPCACAHATSCGVSPITTTRHAGVTGMPAARAAANASGIKSGRSR